LPIAIKASAIDKKLVPSVDEVDGVKVHGVFSEPSVCDGTAMPQVSPMDVEMHLAVFLVGPSKEYLLMDFGGTFFLGMYMV
jgi:hypothetical protein